MPKIVRVIPNDDHTLFIELNNGHKIIYDMKPRLESVRFCHLGDLSRFKAVRVKYEHTLVWDSLCEVTIDEVIDTIHLSESELDLVAGGQGTIPGDHGKVCPKCGRELLVDGKKCAFCG